MKYEIRTIKPAVFARMTGIAFVIPSLIVSLVWIIFLLLSESVYGYFGGETISMIVGILVGVLLIYLLGLIFGLLFAVIYNWIAEKSKGIELEIDLTKDEIKKDY